MVDLGTEVARGRGNDVLIGIENVVGSAFDDVIKGTDRERHSARRFATLVAVCGRGGSL